MNTWRMWTPGRDAAYMVLCICVHRSIASYNSKIKSRPGKIRLQSPTVRFLRLGIRICWNFTCDRHRRIELHFGAPWPVWLSVRIVHSSKLSIYMALQLSGRGTEIRRLIWSIVFPLSFFTGTGQYLVVFLSEKNTNCCGGNTGASYMCLWTF